MNGKKLEEIILCPWKISANQEFSTTFMQVSVEKVDHPLYKCKYDCTGTEGEPCYVKIKDQEQKYKNLQNLQNLHDSKDYTGVD